MRAVTCSRISARVTSSFDPQRANHTASGNSTRGATALVLKLFASRHMIPRSATSVRKDGGCSEHRKYPFRTLRMGWTGRFICRTCTSALTPCREHTPPLVRGELLDQSISLKCANLISSKWLAHLKVLLGCTTRCEKIV